MTYSEKLANSENVSRETFQEILHRDKTMQGDSEKQNSSWFQPPHADSLAHSIESYIDKILDGMHPYIETIRCEVCSEITRKYYTFHYYDVSVHVCSAPCKRTFTDIAKKIVRNTVERQRSLGRDIAKIKL